MMYRFAFAALAATLLAANPASAQTKWNLPSAYPNDNPHVENLNAFAKDVSDATGGKLTITVVASSATSPWRRPVNHCGRRQRQTSR